MNFDIKEVKIEIYIPEEYIEEIRNALTLAGACRAGNYDHVLSYHERILETIGEQSPVSRRKRNDLLRY